MYVCSKQPKEIGVNINIQNVKEKIMENKLKENKTTQIYFQVTGLNGVNFLDRTRTPIEVSSYISTFLTFNHLKRTFLQYV